MFCFSSLYDINNHHDVWCDFCFVSNLYDINNYRDVWCDFCFVLNSNLYDINFVLTIIMMCGVISVLLAICMILTIIMMCGVISVLF